MADQETIGECLLTTFDDPRRIKRVRIDRADSVIRIHAELLDEIHTAQAKDDPGLYASLADGLLTIHGSNRTVVYRIGEYLAEQNVYVGHRLD